MTNVLAELAQGNLLGTLLDAVRSRWSSYDILNHWQQGEFHHDIVLRLDSRRELPGDVLVVATNCNGGIKEVLCTSAPPDRWGLWRMRCPDNPEFEGTPPDILAMHRTEHWFDPCELLAPDARSELRPECRTRMRGGGWTRK